MHKCYINSIASIHPEPEDAFFVKACEPDYKEIIVNAGQRRRMSRIIKMGVSAALTSLQGYTSSQIDAIITATGLGCLSDTEKFMTSLIDSEERLLNPTPFIQSTPNTIGGQIALICQVNAYNVTYSHRGFSFESALIDAMMCIEEGKHTVLVGAMDEITQASYAIQKRMGLLNNIKAGEGAHFFVLGSHPTEDTFAQLVGVETFGTPDSSDILKHRINRFLNSMNVEAKDISCIMVGKNGHRAHDMIYQEIESALFPNAVHSMFKDICGEYQTASAYAFWKASALLKECSNVNNVLIYNHYNNINHSLILLGR